ncbi:hypothetical protein Unana1_03763 [Umbelopsis nana]
MSSSEKIALKNVRVFDGDKLLDPSTVVIDGELIGTDPTGAKELDCSGAVLLPGLIDAHIHLMGVKDLEILISYGVTTGLDMGTWPIELLNSLRGRKGLTDIRSSGIPASAPGSMHSHFIPKESLITGLQEAKDFVPKRIAEGSDYIKIIADIPWPDQEMVNLLTAEAHRHGKLAIAHATTLAPFHMAQVAKVDMITHVPTDKCLDQDAVNRMVAENTIAIPTLTMMETVTKLSAGLYDYVRSKDSVTAMYESGMPILAGSGANSVPGLPWQVPHGESIHYELELLVEAGLSTLDAIRAATSLPAKYFGLIDRGVIEPGRRADLVLIAEDPL